MLEPASKQKLAKLPHGYRVSKRPLIRPSIPSPYTNAKQAKIIYVTAHMPFISAVKRVRKLQEQITKRSLGKVSILDDEVGSDKRSRSDAQKLKQISAKDPKPEPIFLKGTGKAIEKVLSLAHYFQGQEDCRVQLETYSAAAVDDLEKIADAVEGEGNIVDEKNDTMMGESSTKAEEPYMPDSRIRWISGLQVSIMLK